MAIDFAKLMLKADGIVSKQGLYTDVTYVEKTEDATTYNPITGAYTTTSVTHSFKAVLGLEDVENAAKDTYGRVKTLIIFNHKITFSPSVDQLYTIDAVDWHVINVTEAPQNTVYTLLIERK
jgi:hypothetical protein